MSKKRDEIKDILKNLKERKRHIEEHIKYCNDLLKKLK
jgi:hypothetical protein